MAWSLEIHHIGLANSGDATLVVARNDGVGLNQQVQTRSLLIDGGLHGQGARVHNYITNAPPNGAGLAALDVIAVTHYDQDHFNGIRYLLNRATAVYNNVYLFDQGRPAVPAMDDDCLRYIAAINSRGNRHRITGNIWSSNVGPPGGWGLAAPGGGWGAYNWLVNREILWTNHLGVNRTPAQILGAAVGTNANPPRVTCYAANQFVQGAGGNNPVAGLGNDQKNEKSLAFLIQFGNFKYYLGGDLETAQEDYLAATLNPTNNNAGRVHAVKLSHHGANTASSAAFLNRLRPKAAFISNGPRNRYHHPMQNAVDHLEAVANLENYYLTGESNRVGRADLDANFAEVPGFPAGYVGGKHIRLTVSNAQSANAAAGVGVVNFTVHWMDLAPPAMAAQRNH